MRNELEQLLYQLEGELRAISVQVWTCTVDDPETATIESEEEGMTPERYQRREVMKRVNDLADMVEHLRNKTSTQIHLTDDEASVLVRTLEWSVDKMEERLELRGYHKDALEIYEPRISAAMALREQVLSKAQQQ